MNSAPAAEKPAPQAPPSPKNKPALNHRSVGVVAWNPRDVRDKIPFILRFRNTSSQLPVIAASTGTQLPIAAGGCRHQSEKTAAICTYRHLPAAVGTKKAFLFFPTPEPDHDFSPFLTISHEFSRFLTDSHNFSLILAISRHGRGPFRLAVPAPNARPARS